MTVLRYFDETRTWSTISGSSVNTPFVLSPPAGTTIAGLVINQTLSGNAGATNWNSITISSDNVAGAFLCDLNMTHSFGGAAATGARVGIFNWLIQTAVTSAAQVGNTLRVYLPTLGISQTNTGDGGTGTADNTALGTYFGSNFVVRNGGTNLYNMFSTELDVMSTSTSSARYSAGAAIVNFEAVQGAAADAGVLIYSGGSVAASGGSGPWGPGVGFHNGILFAELASNTLVPIDSGGTVLGTHLESLSNIPVTNGIDLRGFLVSGLAFASTGFTVNGVGQTSLGAATTAKASLNIPSGTAPTSPVDGDIWFDGSALHIRISGVTKTFTVT